MRRFAASVIGMLGILCYGLPATAAEVVLFQFQDIEVKILRQDFEAMAQSGTLPEDIQQVLGVDLQLPPEIQQILSRPIPLPSATGDFLGSETGEFLLGRLDQLISSTSGQRSDNLIFLRSAIRDASDQQQVLWLDLIRQYPQRTVKVNLTGLEDTYQQVAQFIGDIQSESNPTRQFIANLLCNCPQAQTPDTGLPQTAAAPLEITPCRSSSITWHPARPQPTAATRQRLPARP